MKFNERRKTTTKKQNSESVSQMIQLGFVI